MVRWQITAFLIVVLPTTAMACLNDRETIRSEKEFRSSYGQSQVLSIGDQGMTKLPSQRIWNWPAIIASAAGITMIGCSVLIARKNLST